MFDKFADLEDKISQLEGRLSDPELVTNQKEFRKVVKEHAHLTKLNTIYSSFRQVQQEIEESKALLHDEDEDLELKELARAEIEELETKEKKLDEEIKLILLPRDPNDEKNTFLEIRAGTGGDEAALFVGDLFRMYSRFAESMGWRVETISSSPLGIGGFKEIIALISGDKGYSKLKFESGVHRVQRVPETETQGRVHTSAVTVAILPEADEVELNIDMNELKIDVFRSSGPGGQSVNTTDSAIRITHLPTGLSRDRKSQVGSGDRSERIRTYNFPQGRMTDHRINLTLYKLEAIVSGKLEEVIFPLIAHDQAEKLKEIQ